MNKLPKLDFFTHVLPLLNAAAIAILTYLFIHTDGITYWIVLLGFPLLCAIIPIAFYFRTRGSQSGGEAGGAFVSSVLYMMCLGAELCAWLVSKFWP